MSGYRLSRRADRDLLDIFLYGLEAHGLAQAERYVEDLRECFDRIARLPRMGRRSPEFGEATRRHEHASHVVVYEEGENDVLILAIVHGASMPLRLDPG